MLSKTKLFSLFFSNGICKKRNSMVCWGGPFAHAIEGVNIFAARINVVGRDKRRYAIKGSMFGLCLKYYAKAVLIIGKIPVLL